MALPSHVWSDEYVDLVYDEGFSLVWYCHFYLRVSCQWWISRSGSVTARSNNLMEYQHATKIAEV